MTTITVVSPLAVQEPRGAVWAAWAFGHLLTWFVRAAERRALRRQALSRATEAAAVRAYAHDLEALDPRFAADLRAAADRHQLAD